MNSTQIRSSRTSRQKQIPSSEPDLEGVFRQPALPYRNLTNLND